MRGHEGKVALVTGAGQGIGQVYARRLAQEGVDVVALDMQEPTETLELIRGAGRRALSYVGDVSDPNTADGVAAAIDEEFGHLDILVNNAGIYPIAAFEDVSVEDWNRIRSVNLDGPFMMCKAFVPGMRKRGWGRIVNQASSILHANVTECSAYTASKAGIVGLTRALASEVGVDGVTVNAIAPGLVGTPGTMGRDHGPGGLSWDEESALMASVVQSIKRVSTPEDLAGTLAFLTSDEAEFITAQTIFADGGGTRVA